MIKTFKNILVLTLLAAISASCSMAFLGDEESAMDGDLTLVITGVVSDVVTNAPISDIKITFSAFAENSLSVLPIASTTATTDSKGIYTVEIFGFAKPVTCSLTAASTDQTADEYVTMTNKIFVNWSGSSFDNTSRTFYVNDCNFQMKKN
jgi:hypothetical protein